MNSRTIAVIIAVPAALALAGCSSTVDGQPQAVGSTAGFPSKGVVSTPPSTGSTSSSPSAPSSSPDDSGVHLGAQLGQGLASARTAHIQLAVGVAGQAILANGKEKLSGGKLVALSLAETIPQAGELDLIIVSGKTYVKLPAALQTGPKPWLLVRPGSSNPTVQALATSLASSQESASLDSVTAFVTAAKSIKNLGSATANGIQTTHYSIVVSVAKLPDSYPGKSTLTAGGLTTIPLQLFVDSSGRPVRVKETLSAEGQTIQTKVNITKYNQPVTITAPPASQVSTD
jgi:hypothetical protein